MVGRSPQRAMVGRSPRGGVFGDSRVMAVPVKDVVDGSLTRRDSDGGLSA